MQTARRRRFFIPETVQTSAMDCGPATLKCLLEGYGIGVSYGRLRDACQTDVDGTSIDTLEEAAVALGLDAEQVMIPADHLLAKGEANLPALAVVLNPDGMTHFIVVWRQCAGRVQIMDPARGRLWVKPESLVNRLYRHTTAVPAADWRAWAGTADFLNPLAARLKTAGIAGDRGKNLLADALSDASWRSLATLDALTRFFAALNRSGGRDARQTFEALYRKAKGQAPGEPPLIPEEYWTVRPGEPDGEEEKVLLRGAVLVRVKGRRADLPGVETPPAPSLSAELAAALSEKPLRPLRSFLALLRRDGLLAPAVLCAAFFAGAGAAFFEAVLWRSLMDIGRDLGLASQRLAAIALLVAFTLAQFFLDASALAGTLRLGRRIEAALRIALYEKIPRLYDRYFQSRLLSDMAERGHSVRQLRNLPQLGRQFLKTGFELAFCAAGVVWIHPRGAPEALLLLAASLLVPLVTEPFLAEKDLRARNHAGALRKSYLDALSGLLPLRAHAAERNLRREHENRLAEWREAALDLQRFSVLAAALQQFLTSALAVRLLFGYFSAEPLGAGALLLVYWAMSLPVLGNELALTARQYPVQRNLLGRLMEPLMSPDEDPADAGPPPPEASRNAETAKACAVRFDAATVKAAGHTILDDINIDIAPGNHVAVVGESGAGKSSLLGLLLGWNRCAGGRVTVDERELTPENLSRLRLETAWIDPAVQLWNKSLLENLKYGMTAPTEVPLEEVIEAAGLAGVLERLPDGLKSPLGEAGALVSGGEGQRVRFGRALNRPKARLALLDEPFRGLDRGMRAEFLKTARRVWREATLLCVTHDIAETLDFPRVIVMQGGRIVEDGNPAELARRTDSPYGIMLEGERALRENLWSARTWKKIRLEDGRLASSGTERES